MKLKLKEVSMASLIKEHKIKSEKVTMKKLGKVLQ